MLRTESAGRKWGKNRANVNFTMEQAWGRPIMHFMGIPIKRCDEMLATETALS